jgi:DNA modification methylase
MKVKAEIINGDCLVEVPRLAARGVAVDAVITDPPYGIDYQSSWRIDSRARLPKIANDTRPFIEWLPDAFRLTREGGCLLCFCRWDVQEVFKVAIAHAGFEVKSQVIWDRMSHGMGDLEGSFAPQHDVIWFAVKGRFRFPGARPKSVLRHMRLSGEELNHPNEKPVSLMSELVRAVTAEGGAVADFFGGSFATGEACVNEGRDFYGVELDSYYSDFGRARLMRAQGQPCDIPRVNRRQIETPLFDGTQVTRELRDNDCAPEEFCAASP